MCLMFFRFHTVTEDGNPWLDMAHIVTTLNKLDAGIMEKVRNHLRNTSGDHKLIIIVFLATTNVTRSTIRVGCYLC